MSSSPNGLGSFSSRRSCCFSVETGEEEVKRQRSWKRLKASKAEGRRDVVEPSGRVVGRPGRKGKRTESDQLELRIAYRRRLASSPSATPPSSLSSCNTLSSVTMTP
jgi:hypothetical protein